ncbi:MAG: ATP synthase F0 subunit B [Pyrinomonadaceae bacterium]|nr:ATP synthase F0 subunit B [Pyrinomonadaceae bacterium]
MLAFLFNYVLIYAAPTAGGTAGQGGFTEFYNHYLNFPGFEAWRFFNLAIFVAVIVYLIKKPLSAAFKTKRETIRAELIKAEAERQAALAQLTATEAKLAQLDAETQTIRGRAAQEADDEKSRIIGQTDFEINKMREQANNEIERKSQLVRAELRRFSAEESIRLAEEKIRREINADKDAQIVKANIQSIGGLN